jgi:hypothetical protein
MSRVIVVQFISLDGVTEDPDGSGGTEIGGWAFRYGPEAVAGDKFELGEVSLHRQALRPSSSSCLAFRPVRPIWRGSGQSLRHTTRRRSTFRLRGK